MNVTGLDIFTLLKSKTSEGIALRESLGNYLQLGDEGSSSSSRYQEDLLNAVISNYPETSKSQSTTSASISDHFVFLNTNIHKKSKNTWSPLETNWSANGSPEGWSSVKDFTSFLYLDKITNVHELSLHFCPIASCLRSSTGCNGMDKLIGTR
jgi:hypothetical protein